MRVLKDLKDYLAGLEPGLTLVLQVKRDDATMSIRSVEKWIAVLGGIRLGFGGKWMKM